MPSLFRDVTRATDVVGDVLVLLGPIVAVATAMFLLAMCVATAGGTPTALRRAAHGGMRRRAVRSFAAAVTTGDMAFAEIQARRILSLNDTPELARPHGWDERVLLDCTWAEAAAQLRGLDTLGTRFPSIRHVHDDGSTDILVGRRGRVHLRVLSEHLVTGEGLRFAADTGGTVIIGHLTLLLVPPPTPAATGDGAEVWVHAEAPRCWRSRRALRAARSTTKAGLRRWASARHTT